MKSYNVCVRASSMCASHRIPSLEIVARHCVTKPEVAYRARSCTPSQNRTPGQRGTTQDTRQARSERSSVRGWIVNSRLLSGREAAWGPSSGVAQCGMMRFIPLTPDRKDRRRTDQALGACLSS